MCSRVSSTDKRACWVTAVSHVSTKNLSLSCRLQCERSDLKHSAESNRKLTLSPSCPRWCPVLQPSYQRYRVLYYQYAERQWLSWPSDKLKLIHNESDELLVIYSYFAAYDVQHLFSCQVHSLLFSGWAVFFPVLLMCADQ